MLEDELAEQPCLHVSKLVKDTINPVELDTSMGSSKSAYCTWSTKRTRPSRACWSCGIAKQDVLTDQEESAPVFVPPHPHVRADHVLGCT